MGIQNWQKWHYCQFCAIVKNPHWYCVPARLVQLIHTNVMFVVCELKDNMERVPCGDERGLCDDDEVQRCDSGSGG